MNHSAGAAYGYIWLNRVFVKRGSHFRLWKTSDIRLSKFEAVVMAVIALALMAVSVPIVMLLMKWSFIAESIWLWPILLINLVLAWMIGRRVAKASPYSRFTGENIFDWMTVTSDKRNTLLGRVVGHRVAVNEVTSWVNGKPQSVEAIEWIGSSRAPQAPPHTAGMSDDALVTVTLRPRTDQTNWIQEVRDARRAEFMNSLTPQPVAPRRQKDSTLSAPSADPSLSDASTFGAQDDDAPRPKRSLMTKMSPRGGRDNNARQAGF